MKCFSIIGIEISYSSVHYLLTDFPSPKPMRIKITEYIFIIIKVYRLKHSRKLDLKSYTVSKINTEVCKPKQEESTSMRLATLSIIFKTMLAFCLPMPYITVAIRVSINSQTDNDFRRGITFFQQIYAKCTVHIFFKIKS